MELRLTVVDLDGTGCDCRVTCEPTSTVGATRDAVAEHVGRDPSGLALSCARLGGPIPDASSMASSGILDGDELWLVTAAGAPLMPPLSDRYLVVRNGPDHGHWFALDRGRVVLGRGSEAGIGLTDASVSRAMAEVHVDDDIEIVGLAARNPVIVDGSAIERSTPLRSGSVITVGGSELVVVAPSATGAGTVGLHRPPRHIERFAGANVTVPLPPSTSGRNRFPFLSIAVGLFGGLVIALLFRSLIWIVFLLLAPLTAVASYLEARMATRSERREGTQAWRQRLGDIVRQLDIAHERERALRLVESPSPGELARRVATRATTIWERSRADEDVLVVRIGLGSQPARSQAVIDDLTGSTAVAGAEVDQIVRRFERVHDVPITIDLDRDRVVGIAGAGATGVSAAASICDAVVRSIVLQLGSLVSPSDLQLVAFVPANGIERWSWLRWLPHVPTTAVASTGGLGDSALVCGADAIARAVKWLGALSVDAANTGSGSSSADGPVTVLLVDDAAEVSRPALGRLLHDAGASRLRLIWIASDPVRLPPQCALTITDGPDSRTVVVSRPSDGERVVARAEGVDLATAESWARLLAPLRDLSAAVDGAATLPLVAPLPTVLNDIAARDDPAAIESRWQVGRPVEAPIGIGIDGTMLIDLRTDGPHALVAGTTGSGKSELLQSWIAALAATLPPTRLQLLLVDYKGGAAFRECSELPHTAGFITDLTPHLARRALIALNAELRRREGILNTNRAKDLIDLERRDLAAAPPSLVLVIDEFAALANEISEFVDGVVDIAQRGRSLGIHLVLATQRPAGVVSGPIQANTNLRIALRTAPGESEDVIGTADAEAIDTPGRAYVRIGARKPVPVQVAYAGGVTDASDHGAVLVRALGPSVDGGADTTAHSGIVASASTSQRAGTDGGSDLQRMVVTINEAWRRRDAPRPPSPILDPLPDVLPLDSLTGMTTTTAPAVTAPTTSEIGLVVLGLLDEPESQRQYPAVVDLDVDGGLLIFGATGSGKSVAARTFVCSLASRADADRLVVYGIDGGRGLRPLDALPQVGEIVALDDAERVVRLFAMMRATIDDRAQRFAAAGVTSGREFEDAGNAPLARTILLIDGASAFVAAYGVHAFGFLNDELARIANDGRSVGVHVVLAADRFASVPSELRAAFRRRLVLRQSSVDDYGALGVRVGDDEIDVAPGRGFLDGREIQVALVGDAVDGASQFRAVDRLAATSTQRSSQRAALLPVLGDDVGITSLPAAARALEPVVGIADDLALVPYRLTLWDDHLLVAGPPRSGRSTLAVLLANQLAAAGDEVFIGSPTGRGLSGLAESVTRWTTPDVIADGLAALAERLDRGAVGAANAVGAVGAVIVVIVDDWHELHETALDALLLPIVRRGRELPVRVVVTCDSHVARRPYSSVLDAVRRARFGVLLQPSSDDDITFDVTLPLRNRRFPPGRGVVVRRDGSMTVVQFARP